MGRTSENAAKIFQHDDRFEARLFLNVAWKNIGEGTPRPFHDKPKASQCDALLALFQPEQR